MLIIFFITVICFIFYIVVPHGFKLLWRKNFLINSRQSEYVYLTFDDGPNPTATPQILNLLEEFNVKATFFY